MRNARLRFVSSAFGIALTATVGVVAIQVPAGAEPEIDEVRDTVSSLREEVDALYHEAEQASERLHDAEIAVAEIRKELTSLEADKARQTAKLDVVRDELAESVVSQYQGQSMSAVGQMVLSEDPAEFLADLSALSSYQDVQSELFESYATEAQALELRADAIEDRTAELERVEKRLAEEKATIDEKAAAAEEKLDEAEDLLGELEAEERARLAISRGEPTSTTVAPPPVEGSGRGAVAVRFALSQLGDAYVWGGNGPSVWDCSGLTTAAWAAAGVGIPRSSSAQYGAGPHVSVDQLQPGDLVFYYSPISHVGMYIGNGQIVHAARPGVGVVITGLHTMPYVGAVRPG